MPPEDLEPVIDGDLGPLIQRLNEYGGTLVFTAWVDEPDSMTVKLDLPSDQFQTDECRKAVAEWRESALGTNSQDG